MAYESVGEPDAEESRQRNEPHGGSGETPSRSRSPGDEPSFMEWLSRYSMGRMSAPDEMPPPPPSILEIMNNLEPSSGTSSAASSPLTPSTSVNSESNDIPSPSLPAFTINKPRRGPISLAITLSQGSSQPSSTASNSSASTNSLLNPAVTDEMAAALLEHYRKHGTFPAPPGPFEEERLRLAHKYGLDQPVRRKAIDRICAIAKAHFKTKMVVVSLTLDDYQLLGAERGFDPAGEPTFDDPLRHLGVEPAFCTHAMASSYPDPSQVFIVADANKDWRFARNPYATRNGGGISFYAAANVNLPTGDDADKRGLPSTLASGALCLMDSSKKLREPSDFSQEDRAVLSDLAEMIAREFQLGFEQRRREEESKQSQFLGSFLQQALVQPAQPGCLRPASSGTSSSSTPLHASPRNSPDHEDGQPTKASARFDGSGFDFPSEISGRSTPNISIGSDIPILATPVTPQKSSYRPFSAPGTPASPRNGSSRSDPSAALGPSLFTTAAANLVSLTRGKSCGILDLRAFRSTHFQPQPDILRSSVSLSPVQSSHSKSPLPSPSELKFTSRSRKDSAPTAPKVTRSRTDSYGVGPSDRQERSGKIGLMASEGTVDWRGIVRKSAKIEQEKSERAERNDPRDARNPEAEKEDALALAIEETLRMCASMSPQEVDLFGLEGAFSAFAILPKDTSDTCCVPIFDVDGVPSLMIVLSSTEKWFRFESTDRRFAQSVGAVLVGSLLRERARESDRAKLAFISQVSHEVRTPLYGVSSQLSLIREFSTPVELRKLAPLLDVAEICVDSLSSVLEDTLDFSKLANTSVHEETALQKKRLSQVNLVTLVEGVLKSTWIKKKRGDLASIDLGEVLESKSTGGGTAGKLDLILEVEDKPDGWEVMTDVAGLRRVLLNIVGNALKFTSSGHVKIAMRYAGQASPTTPDLMTPRPRRPSLDRPSIRGYVVFVVEDTGIGIPPEFLRDGGMFTPFRQADSFASGVGLGLSICDSIVKRLGPGRIDVSSEVGTGTEILITLPIDFLVGQQSANSFPFNFSSASRPGTSSRRNISKELDDLFKNPTNLLHVPSPAAKPFPSPSSALQTSSQPPAPSEAESSELLEVDFPAAVAALHNTLSPVAPDASKDDGPDDLAIEAAKLAIAARTEVESTVIPMRFPKGTEIEETPQKERGTETSPAPSAPKAEDKKVEKLLEQQRKLSIAPNVHVLFADDNPVARNILIKLFSGKGIKFSAAEDGQQAVESFVAASGEVSIILMDVQMPVMDGIAATHAIRLIEVERGWERCRIIALTGLSNESDMAEAIDGGVDKWLVKGGKSLRTIMDEVVDVQKELEERISKGV